MIDYSEPYHLLGKFIVTFQQTEECVKELIALLVNAKDEEMSYILMNELGFSSKLKTLDVLFQRFTSVRVGNYNDEVEAFHKLVTRLIKLAERRNDIVHSNYYDWTTIEGDSGLLRQNSKLRGKQGVRAQSEEELLPENLREDLKSVANAYGELDSFRLKIIDWD